MNAATARTVGFFGLHLVYFPALIGLIHVLMALFRVLDLARFEQLTSILTLVAAAALYVGMGYGTDWLLHRRYGEVPIRHFVGPGA